MKIYTVHIRHSGLDPDRDVVLVKEGFSWPAFLFSVFWALSKRLWLAALLLGLLNAAVSLIVFAFAVDPTAQGVLSLGLGVVVGFIANDLWRWTLSRQGFVESGVVAAADKESAWQRLFDSEPLLARQMTR